MADLSPKPFHQRFPPEIRNMIYMYALEDTYPSNGMKLYRKYDHLQAEQDVNHPPASYEGTELTEAEYKAANVWYTPPLLLLCKQVTKEVLPILQEQTFHLNCRTPGPLDSPIPLEHFVRPETIRNLKKVAIRMPFFFSNQEPISDTMNAILTLLKQGSALEELKIHFIWVFSHHIDDFNDGDVREWVYKMIEYRRIEAQIQHHALLLCEAPKARSYKTLFEFDVAALIADDEEDAEDAESNFLQPGLIGPDDEDFVILEKNTFKQWGFTP